MPGGSRGSLSLVVDGVAMPQADLMHNLGDLLDSQLLLEHLVAVMTRRAFAQLRCYVTVTPLPRSESHSLR